MTCPLARAKTPLGTWGKITRQKLGPTTWRARATMCGYDGKPRMYQMTGPTGAQAEAALLAKLNAMLPPSDDVISPEMAMSELAKFWWLEFEDLNRAANTRRGYFLPPFAVEMLRRRQADPIRQHDLGLVFPSSVLTSRDPNGFRKHWRDARKAVGFDWVTPHTFRKPVGTILANTQGMAAATAQLGHSSEQITSKHYVQKTHEAPDQSEFLQAFGQVGGRTS